MVDLGELLYREPEWDNRARVADALDVRQQVISPWLNYLEFFRAIRERGSGLEVSESRLLSVLANYRAGNLRPERPVPIAGDAGEVHALLEDAAVPHAFAMFSAANRWAFYEPQRDVQLYLPRGEVSKLREALEPLEPTRSATGSELGVFVEALGGIAIEERDGLPVTSPFQTVVDLRAHPTGGAHADFLETNLLPALREASD